MNPPTTRTKTVRPCVKNKSMALPACRFVVVALIAATGCNSGQLSSGDGEAPEKPVTLAATAWPLQFLSRRIMGSAAQVELVARPPDQQESWYPDAASIARLQAARLIITNGAGYESWMQSITVPAKRVLDTTVDCQAELIPLEGRRVHQHGPEGSRSRRHYASRTWLDPGLAIQQARAIRDRLSEQFPARVAELERNFALLDADLVELRQAAKQAGFAADPSVPVLDPDGVFPYFARATGLTLTPVKFSLADIQAGEVSESDAAEIAGSLVLVPAHADPSLDDRLTGLGLTAVRLDPLESPVESGDYLTGMQTNLQKLQEAFPEDR